MTSINYLMPLVVKHTDQEYICFIDYNRDKVYFSNKDLQEDLKKELTDYILSKVNNKAIVDIKSYDISSNVKINKIINDIKNDTIRRSVNKSFEENQ